MKQSIYNYKDGRDGLTQHTARDEPAIEVCVRAKLTNYLDRDMAEDGNQPAPVRSLEVDAIVHTGMTHCALPDEIAKTLGLGRPRTQYDMDGGPKDIQVTFPVLLEIMGRWTHQACLVGGDRVLIGQVALTSTDLFVDCATKRVVPNPEHPNGPVFRV